MTRNIAVALSLAVGSFAIAASALAQRTPITPPPGTTTAGSLPPRPPEPNVGNALKDAIKKQNDEIGNFTAAFSYSLDSGKTYYQMPFGGTLPSSICPSGGSTSLCATGTKPWDIYVRIPNISTAVDLAEVFPLIGRTLGHGGPVYHFAVLRVDSLSTKGKTCSNAALLQSSNWAWKPGDAIITMPIRLDEPWTGAAPTPDPVITCVWQVVAGVYDRIVTGPVHVIWSNQVRLDIGRRP